MRILSLFRPRSLNPAGELLDLALGGVQALAAEPVQLLATLPELQRFVERGVTAFQALDDLLQLPLRFFEGGLLRVQRVSSTRAPKPPSASSTSTRSPGATAVPARTISSPERTIA